MNLRTHKRRAVAGMERRRQAIGAQFSMATWAPVLSWQLDPPYLWKRRLHKADAMRFTLPRFRASALVNVARLVRP